MQCEPTRICSIVLVRVHAWRIRLRETALSLPAHQSRRRSSCGQQRGWACAWRRRGRAASVLGPWRGVRLLRAALPLNNRRASTGHSRSSVPPAESQAADRKNLAPRGNRDEAAARLMALARPRWAVLDTRLDQRHVQVVTAGRGPLHAAVCVEHDSPGSQDVPDVGDCEVVIVSRDDCDSARRARRSSATKWRSMGRARVVGRRTSDTRQRALLITTVRCGP
jgi:hypothetical protein